MRRSLVLVMSLVAPLLTSGCTVPSYGVTGVGVDAKGRIVGYLRVCSHYIDGATLYDDHANSVGSWTAPQRVIDFTAWTLVSPPAGWKADPPLGRLRPATQYTLYGWTKNNSSSTESVDFGLEQLAQLKPGQVLHWSSTNPDGGVTKVESVEEFRRSACVGM